MIGVATDITARHRSELQLAHDAYHDRLTGLANRANLEVPGDGHAAAEAIATGLGQGFALARPMPAADATALLQSPCSGRGGPPSRASRHGTYR